MLIVEDWAEIRRLRRSEGVSISEIARVVGCSRNTVKAALASEGPPRYERAPAGSLVDEYEPRIRELLRAFPRMPATVIAERVGWPYSIRTLSGRVAELRPVYLPPDPAGRTAYAAGEIAQCDFWFPDIELPVGFGQTRAAKLLPVLTMVCGYSRFALAMLLPSRSAADLYAGWWRLIEQLGAVPKVLVWDGEGAVGRWRARRVELTGDCQGFRGTLGTKVIICKPADPEAKGLVERLHDYLERSFLPGRQFSCPADFNSQLAEFLVRANSRQHRVLGCRPVDRVDADRQAMLSLPPVPPVTGWQAFDAVAAGSLSALRQQRLLGPSSGDRPEDPGPCGSGSSSSVVRGTVGRRPSAGLGPAPDRLGVRASARRPAAAPGPGRGAASGPNRG